MEKKKTIEAYISHIIALYHILDNYSEFIQNLSSLISTKYNRDTIYNLYKISKGKFVVGSRKIKRFYQENKTVVDTINKYSDILSFINLNYDYQGNLSENSSLEFFYQYLSSHKDELNQILSVLEKLKELGFNEFKFDEDANFACNEYAIDTCINRNIDINYLDNIQVVPNYQNNVVKYRTTGSNYCIIAKTSFGKLCAYEKTITLNSLIFDVKRLPETITKENIFDKLVSLKEEQKENCSTIKNSIDLSISIDDLRNQFDSTNRIIEGLNSVDSKDGLQDVLLKIKEYIDKLQTISTEYDDSISQGYSSITKEKLEKEKQLYLKRRYWDSIDID